MKHVVEVEIIKKGLFTTSVEKKKKKFDDRTYKKLVKKGKIVNDRMTVTEEEMSMLDMCILDDIMGWD